MTKMRIHEKLHPKLVNDGKTFIGPANHTLSRKENKKMCRCLYGVKVPSGFSANVKGLVSMDELKLSEMKLNNTIATSCNPRYTQST